MKLYTHFLTGFLILSAGTSLKAWDKKDKALAIGATTTLIGGEMIRQAILHNQSLIHFFKERPHILIAGLALSAIAVRQYKDAVINPIIEWASHK